MRSARKFKNGARFKTPEKPAVFDYSLSRRANPEIAAAFTRAEEFCDRQEQHGPVRVLVKDGKPVRKS